MIGGSNATAGNTYSMGPDRAGAVPDYPVLVGGDPVDGMGTGLSA